MRNTRRFPHIRQQQQQHSNGRNRSESLSRTSLKWVKFTEIRIFRTESQNLAVGRWVLARCRLGLLILQSSVGRALSGTAKKVLRVRDFGGALMAFGLEI
uniref:Uncharacterized protein n=1 Tax=Oryza rufipogon TaxID=4529 RepID=A0A0E0MVX6_ORYRU